MASLQEVTESVSDHMDEIKSLFKPGVKITVLVRTPDHPDRDFMLTDDEPNQIIAMVLRRTAPPQQRDLKK